MAESGDLSETHQDVESETDAIQGQSNEPKQQSHSVTPKWPIDTASDADSAQDLSYGTPLSPIQEYLQQVRPPESATTNGPVALFKNIKVWGGDTQLAYQESVLSLLLYPLRLLLAIFSRRKPVRKLIVNDVDGVLVEGEMLLVLGKPGSGCTTLLKTLAGSADSFHGWSGDINYYGVQIDEIKKKFRGDLIYNAEHDIHFPRLTVGQTLEFAIRTKTRRKGLEHHVGTMMHTLLKIFGLESTTTTLVGNEFVNGVSGGERKRVSLAEVMAMTAKVSLWDNSTQGLDASTSIRFGKTLRNYTQSGHNIAVAALYQASDDLANLFDKVTLLHQGRQIFFGTIVEAKDYFISLGFVLVKRQSISEFLVAVTDPSICVTREGWENRVPRSAEDFVRQWKESANWRKLEKELIDGAGAVSQDTGLRMFESRSQSTYRGHSSRSSMYVLSWTMQLAVTLQRTIQRLNGDRRFLIASVVGPIFVSLIFGSAFYNTPNSTQGFFSRQGVIYFGILFNVIQTLGEITTQYAQRPIVQKQHGFAMYHPGIDAMSSFISLWPIKFISTTIFNLVIYFLANLKREPGAFFIFLLFTYTTVLLMSSLFRLVAAVSKHEATAVSIAGVLLLALVIYTGYVIPRPSMHPWFKWISYINPIAYSFEALMANEFHEREVPCSTLIPSGPNYKFVSLQNQVCPVTGSIPGSASVSGDRYIGESFGYYYSHLWRNYGILIGYFLFFVVAYGLAVEFIPQIEKGKGDVLIFLRRRKGQLEGDLPKEKRRDDIETGQINDQNSTEPTSANPTKPHKLERKEANFTWRKLEYEIPVKAGTKILLTAINGYIATGTMTGELSFYYEGHITDFLALIGESGAGKTTLLNVLATRTRVGIVRGDILFNGSALDQSFERKMGYVESQDIHLSQFTVRETLRLSAELRQPQQISRDMKHEYVEQVIAMLEMEAYSDAVVGVPGSGLSLEQRKKLTLGIELVAKPSLLFLDEPTSGLDSQSSWTIIRILRKLAESGLAILCTIHQPSSSLFEEFDRIMLLQKGGRCVYFGDIGVHSRTIIDYFESNGAAKCPDKANPAEYILQIAEARYEKSDEMKWAEIWQNSNEARTLDQHIVAFSQPTTASDISSQTTPERNSDIQGGASIFTQYKYVQKRSFQIYWRSPTYIRGKLLLNLAAGLFLGFTFYKESNSAQGLQNKMFATFTSVILSAPLMNQIQPRFIELRALYQAREEPSKTYHWSIFVISTVVVEALTNVMTGTLFFFPWYFAIGYWQSITDRNARGAYMWLMIVMFELWVSTFGQLLAALAPNAQIAALFIPLTFVFVALFCGVLQPYSQLVRFWRFVHFLSPFTWLISGLFSNVLHDITVRCNQVEVNIFQPPQGKTCGQFAGPFLSMGSGALYNPQDTANCQYCRYSTGDEYLKTLNINWTDRWRNFGFMWVYVCFNLGMIVLATYIPRGVRQIKKKRQG